ncbi:hypothetical protein BGX38DRAFT_1203025 [Terfezia claveryi]|nr:hypothetical protein BGX38DRAFT_1203025 [Terfezia claveryi]
MAKRKPSGSQTLTEPTGPRSIWKSYQNLSSRARLLIGGAVIAYSLAGLWVADKAEKKLGFTPSEEDKKELRDLVPRVRVVDRKD